MLTDKTPPPPLAAALALPLPESRRSVEIFTDGALETGKIALKPLAGIIDAVFAARPATISFAAATPRRAHEWARFERVKPPEGKIIIPGVIESKSNFIEIDAEKFQSPQAHGRNGDGSADLASDGNAPFPAVHKSGVARGGQ